MVSGKCRGDKKSRDAHAYRLSRWGLLFPPGWIVWGERGKYLSLRGVWLIRPLPRRGFLRRLPCGGLLWRCTCQSLSRPLSARWACGQPCGRGPRGRRRSGCCWPSRRWCRWPKPWRRWWGKRRPVKLPEPRRQPWSGRACGPAGAGSPRAAWGLRSWRSRLCPGGWGSCGRSRLLLRQRRPCSQGRARLLSIWSSYGWEF